MVHCLHPMQCVKYFGIIPISGKDSTFGADHPARQEGQPAVRKATQNVCDRLSNVYRNLNQAYLT
jgi:hypothetical protein